ncbi:sugar phosphate isomerase/epimerase family protein [Franconibacter helveticus 513]|uniref:sugar phosphate isomerase/epimerase family protein n=2 Tax=Franconibacter helveticus TaxID=357240 RepID=UPI0003F5739A|nr:TIM barrel protein [Franconibacter helveticus]
MLNASHICATNFTYSHYRLTRCLDDVAALGVQWFELWGVAPHLHIDTVQEADLQSLKRELAARELKLACFTPEQCVYPVNIAAENPQQRAYSMNYFHRSLEICESLESPLLFMTPGWGYEDDEPDEARRRAVDALSTLAHSAEKRGVTLVLEVLQPRESNLASTVRELAGLVNEVSSPALDAALDIVGMAVGGDSVTDYLTAFGPKLRHCHFIDGTPAGHLAPGDGSLPLKSYLGALRDGGYNGLLSLEIAGGRYWQEPLAPMRQGIQFLREALA